MPAFLARIIAVLAVALLATGCVDLEPRQSNIRYYVLAGSDSTAWSEANATRAGDTEQDAQPGLVVGLRRLRLASYLNTPTIVTRMGPHEVHFAEFHRWGEDLPRAINRTVARHLTTHTGIRRVDVVPWPDRTTHDYVIQIHVHRFEGEAPPSETDADEDVRGLRQVGEPGTVRVVATWEIIDPADESVVRQGTTDQQMDGWTVGRYGALVQSLDAGLHALAEDLAGAIE